MRWCSHGVASRSQIELAGVVRGGEGGREPVGGGGAGRSGASSATRRDGLAVPMHTGGGEDRCWPFAGAPVHHSCRTRRRGSGGAADWSTGTRTPPLRPWGRVVPVEREVFPSPPPHPTNPPRPWWRPGATRRRPSAERRRRLRGGGAWRRPGAPARVTPRAAVGGRARGAGARRPSAPESTAPCHTHWPGPGWVVGGVWGMGGWGVRPCWAAGPARDLAKMVLGRAPRWHLPWPVVRLLPPAPTHSREWGGGSVVSETSRDRHAPFLFRDGRARWPKLVLAGSDRSRDRKAVPTSPMLHCRLAGKASASQQYTRIHFTVFEWRRKSFQ